MAIEDDLAAAHAAGRPLTMPVRTVPIDTPAAHRRSYDAGAEAFRAGKAMTDAPMVADPRDGAAWMNGFVAEWSKSNGAPAAAGVEAPLLRPKSEPEDEPPTTIIDPEAPAGQTSPKYIHGYDAAAKGWPLPANMSAEYVRGWNAGAADAATKFLGRGRKITVGEAVRRIGEMTPEQAEANLAAEAERRGLTAHEMYELTKEAAGYSPLGEGVRLITSASEFDAIVEAEAKLRGMTREQMHEQSKWPNPPKPMPAPKSAWATGRGYAADGGFLPTNASDEFRAGWESWHREADGRTLKAQLQNENNTTAPPAAFVPFTPTNDPAPRLPGPEDTRVIYDGHGNVREVTGHTESQRLCRSQAKEIDRLHDLNRGLAERCAAQSELLTMAAAKREPDPDAANPFHDPYTMNAMITAWTKFAELGAVAREPYPDDFAGGLFIRMVKDITAARG